MERIRVTISNIDSISAYLMGGAARTGVSLGLLLVFVATLGCEAAFEPFNGVDKFRVLSLRADPPLLTEGGITVIEPLIHMEGDEPVTYEWSWCPIAASSKDGGGCIVDEATMQQILEELVASQFGEDVAAATEGFEFSFSLGDGPTARFIYPIPAAVLSSVCKQLISEEIPSFTGIPQCDTKFDIYIRLEATQGETTLQAIKQVPLYIDEAYAANRNPVIDGLTVRDGNKTASAPLVRGRWYDIEADISKDVIDEYTPFPTAEDPDPEAVEEVLFITWYVTGGETDAMRTTYIQDEVAFDMLRRNRWKMPSTYDYPDDVITLFLVLQDEQGGAGWLVREFELAEE